MQKLGIIVCVILLASCSESNDNGDSNIPSCIQEILDDPVLSSDLKTIRVQENNDELQYWLNTDATFFDGVEFIVNSQCETVCSFCGECFPPLCASDYDFESWITIWEME